MRSAHGVTDTISVIFTFTVFFSTFVFIASAFPDRFLPSSLGSGFSTYSPRQVRSGFLHWLSRNTLFKKKKKVTDKDTSGETQTVRVPVEASRD